jgi:hypothetical protein
MATASERAHRLWLELFALAVRTRVQRDNRFVPQSGRLTSIATGTGGWSSTVATFRGEREAQCQVWLDHWLFGDSRGLCATVEISSLGRSGLVAVVGNRRILRKDTVVRGGVHMLRAQLRRSMFERPVGEMFHPAYLSFFFRAPPTIQRPPAQSQVVRVVRFFVLVADAVQASSAMEGMVSEGRALKRARNGTLRQAALDAAHGVCAGCDVDFSRLCTGRGERALQVHHRNQLFAYRTPRLTKVSELTVVCANCHAMIHADPDRAISVGRLRRWLQRGT